MRGGGVSEEVGRSNWNFDSLMMKLKLEYVGGSDEGKRERGVVRGYVNYMHNEISSSKVLITWKYSGTSFILSIVIPVTNFTSRCSFVLYLL